MENNILLSLCIPTDGKVELVIPTIESIYSQGVDLNLFEVIVTDNGESNELETIIKSQKYTNLYYYRTQAVGFTNQVEAFKRSSGLFCKLVSHRCRMQKGSIESLIALIAKFKDTKPIIYCSDGFLKCDELVECNNVDEFVNQMSYRISWSGGTCAWRDDLKCLDENKIDKLFPHIAYLFELRSDSRYVIWNKKITTMQDDRKKGGYNFFQAFGIDLLDIVHELRINKRISTNTFNKIKSDLFLFLSDIYIIEVIIPRHKYVVTGIKDSIRVHYGALYYYYLVILAYCNLPYKVIRKILFGTSALQR